MPYCPVPWIPKCLNPFAAKASAGPIAFKTVLHSILQNNSAKNHRMDAASTKTNMGKRPNPALGLTR